VFLSDWAVDSVESPKKLSSYENVFVLNPMGIEVFQDLGYGARGQDLYFILLRIIEDANKIFRGHKMNRLGSHGWKGGGFGAVGLMLDKPLPRLSEIDWKGLKVRLLRE